MYCMPSSVRSTDTLEEKSSQQSQDGTIGGVARSALAGDRYITEVHNADEFGVEVIQNERGTGMKNFICATVYILTN